MKKSISIFFTLAVIFTFVGCNTTKLNNNKTSSEKSTASESNSSSIDTENKSQTDSAKENAIVKEMTTINILVRNKTFIATIEDNDTTKAFIKQLPLTVDMSELNGNEKYNYLSSNLCADKSISPGKINEGDLMLYGNNCLVLFYKSFNTSYSYVKIGHIDNTTGLLEAVGSGKVNITFSIN
ncbi:cyclophilin-like fold protein [Clostridium folliculivorans]|uniref:Cyclophilin-like domain-containing protein n=1 Tax=Clostridium folliculivorans TaxID=2886038 RepID=A0A9W5Y4Q8_9CLOT|nr:cyclophilin-like fold protein [Clostridium folliculivorans]GKU26483.1 hypothetical protein CFOLD11_33100 [Clostridium folliculivorans]GKU29085.1 hypothetical protein CFB3_11910 [Clostridium folliculivorans]